MSDFIVFTIINVRGIYSPIIWGGGIRRKSIYLTFKLVFIKYKKNERFTAAHDAMLVRYYAVVLCLSVSMSVRPSVHRELVSIASKQRNAYT